MIHKMCLVTGVGRNVKKLCSIWYYYCMHYIRNSAHIVCIGGRVCFYFFLSFHIVHNTYFHL